jgi:uncharacterized protein YbjT (DUF2867 family)
MKNVIILGAGGNIAHDVIALLKKKENIRLTLFLRDKDRIRNKDIENCRIIEGDVLKYGELKDAIEGQDIVYVNLAGDLEKMVENIIRAMKETKVKRIIFISSIGIYNIPVKPALKPYREATDMIEGSGLEYTIIRPTWFTDENEVDYELTKKTEAERGSKVSQKSVASFIAEVIEAPETYIGANLGINKPG